MSIKRILENQLHLHDEGNPAWGMSGNYEDQESKDIAKLAKIYENIKIPKKETIMGNFLQEVMALSKNYNSPKIKEIKKRIKNTAASGKTMQTFDQNLYDRDVINWLEAEGFIVNETNDQRDGSFITVKWVW